MTMSPFPPDDADEPDEELDDPNHPWAGRQRDDGPDDGHAEDGDSGDDEQGELAGAEEGAFVGEDGEEHRAVFVSTALPVALRVAPLDDERAPEGSALGAFIGDRLVARCAMPREAIDQLMEMDLFDEPVPLALLAVEEAPGLQCRLFALVPADRIMDEEEGADEPWRASVPNFEETMAALEDDDDDEDDDGEDGDDDDTAVASILLGHIVRFERDRKYAGDLTAEAVDVLQKIVLGGQLQDANARAVDDLLDSL